MKFGSIFTGIGGFEIGFAPLGWQPVFFSEIDKAASELLARKWPDVPNLGDVRGLATDGGDPVDLVAGGDPCTCRSLARGNKPSNHPDLSGYFLAVVARFRPRWMVRENVPASDAICFAAALEALGYGVAAFALDARDFTAQSRRRQFLVGCLDAESAKRFQSIVFDKADAFGFVSSRREETTPIAACVTAHPCRMAAEDSYCFEPGRGLRVLSAEECEALQGFPRGWTIGFSRSTRRRLIGQAVPPPMVEWIARCIQEAE